MRLTPPTIPVFLVSIVVFLLAIVDLYSHIPHLHGMIAPHRFGMVVAAFAILVAGVVFPGL